MWMYGFSQAVISLRVIASAAWLKCECTEATHTSKPARMSSAQSTPNGGLASIRSNRSPWAPSSASVLPGAIRLGSCPLTSISARQIAHDSGFTS